MQTMATTPIHTHLQRPKRRGKKCLQLHRIHRVNPLGAHLTGKVVDRNGRVALQQTLMQERVDRHTKDILPCRFFFLPGGGGHPLWGEDGGTV